MLITLLACAEPGTFDPVAGNDSVDPFDTNVPTDPAAPPAGDPEPPDTTDTPVEPVDNTPDWDGSAPEGPQGTEVTAIIACSLFLEPLEVVFVKTSDAWLWDIEMGEGGLRIPGLEPCYPADGDGENPVALWDPAPRITIISSGMVHTLEQTMRSDFWAGTLLPVEESSAGCDAVLLDNDLEWPLDLTMTIIDQ